MAQEEQRNSFLIYRTFIDVIKNLDDKDQLLMYQALSRYALDDQQPTNLEGHCKNYWDLMKPNIDSNIKKFYNAKRNRNKTKDEQKENKIRTYVDVNVDEEVDKDIELNEEKLDLLLIEFNKITNINTRMITKKTKKQILERLKEGFTYRDIVIAITNCYADKWHRETGHKHLTLEFITRQDKLERFHSSNYQSYSKNIRMP